MLGSPDRLGSAYEGSLAVDPHSRCQLFIHTHTLLRICCPQLCAVLTSRCPIISEPATHGHCGNFGTFSISQHPSLPTAGVQDKGWTAFCTCKCPPTEEEDGSADKGKSSNTASRNLCSKKRPTRLASLPQTFVSASSAEHGRASARRACHACADSWSANPSRRVTG